MVTMFASLRRWVASGVRTVAAIFSRAATQEVPPTNSVRIDPRVYKFESKPHEKDRGRLMRAEAFGRVVVESSVDVTSECWKVAKGHDEQAVILMTHWHLIELLDGVVVLIGSGAIEPARLQLRAAFESFLTLCFILQKDTEKRGYAWLVVRDVLNRIKTWHKFDTTSEAGKEFVKLTAKEGVKVLSTPDAAEKRTKLVEMIETNPRWKDAYQEYKRLKGQKFPKSPNRPEWFELYNGPVGPGLGTLARHLGYGSQYEILYRHWSNRVHGTDAVQRFKRDGVPPLRSTEDLNMTVNLVASFGFGAMFRLHNYYMPERNQQFAKWYVEKMRPLWGSFEPSPEITQSVRTGNPLAGPQ